MNLLIDAVALFLLGSVLLFFKTTAVDRRPQKIGLVWAVLTLPLYLVYYNDRWPIQRLPLREAIRPLTVLGADPEFRSALTPAIALAGLYLIRIVISWRVFIRLRATTTKPRRTRYARPIAVVNNPIANFLAGVGIATITGATIVSAFSLGWIGALVVSAVITLVYLGALNIVAALAEISIETAKLVAVWLERRVFRLATRVTRMASWLSSLAGKLAPRSWVDRIQQWTNRQETIFQGEQDKQDAELVEGYLRDRRRRRRQLPTPPTGAEPRSDETANDETAAR